MQSVLLGENVRYASSNNTKFVARGNLFPCVSDLFIFASTEEVVIEKTQNIIVLNRC